MNSKLVWLDKFKEKNTIDLIKLLLFFFIVFTFSVNLFYKIPLSNSYVHGLLIDYLIPKFYLAEIFLIPFLFFEVKQLKKVKLNNYFCFLVLLLIGRQLMSQNAIAAFTHLLHFVEILLFFSVVKHDPLFKTKLAEKFILGVLFSVVIFQSLLANYQFVFQKSLLPYRILGETNLHNLANVSRAQFSFGEKILPYGTTAHPNILAGLIVIFSILIFVRIKHCRKTQIVLLANAVLITFITQSITAFITLWLFLAYQFLGNVKNRKLIIICIYYFFFLIVPYLLLKFTIIRPDLDSISRRVSLNQASLQIFEAKPFIGVGINNFTVNLEKYTFNLPNQGIVRFVQPVHNILFLILSEGGVLLLVVLLILISQAKIDGFWSKSLILLAIASLDHYLLSQFSGLSLLAIFYLFF